MSTSANGSFSRSHSTFDEACPISSIMLTSMLGLVLLGGSATSEDAMSARPDLDGSYGLLDEILAEFARDLTVTAEAANP
jgi:hypothetical protein